MRKAIQIIVNGKGDNKEIIALCDDGSIWISTMCQETDEFRYPANVNWEQVRSIPDCCKVDIQGLIKN